MGSCLHRFKLDCKEPNENKLLDVKKPFAGLSERKKTPILGEFWLNLHRSTQ